MLHLVLRWLPCLADRARVRLVCSHWRAITCSHGVAPPLPLLMLPKFRFSSLSSDGALAAVRRLPMPWEFVADDARWVGSSQEWLAGVQPSRYCKRADGKCFLLNAFSHEVVHLPHLSAFNFFNYSVTQGALSPSSMARACSTALSVLESTQCYSTTWPYLLHLT